ncbi:MAG: aromatic amino acid hydroxylase [Deltaproteobacteria bacterium]|nr:aromatic amino acid hydroxylase [Deltaproteobacteria bacterium]
MKRPTIKEKVPAYLHPFVAEQNGSLYTPIDQAGWRYIMRVSRAFFAEHAHQKYLDGLDETGISIEHIPLIDEMDEKLERFGWRACAIVGFIPPAVFMEFLSLGILPIACDMRKLEHLDYTPAPDIVHEAAGHAPIIADQEYADYLYQYGEIARKVIFSSQDMDVYEAIRNLSDTKEDPSSTEAMIAASQKRLDEALARVDFVSEATQLARMGWWTTEYGLVGDMKSPKIYGAGLLSSVGESYHCLGPEVKKIPFSIDCIEMSYDITKPQPQLFVTPSFQRLKEVLEEFAGRLAFRRGGLEGLEKARVAATVTTTQLDSGIQIGGLLSEIVRDARGEPAYLCFKGPCQLASGEFELPGQGVSQHQQGFGTPVGKLKDGRSPAELDDAAFGKGRLEFASGVVVEGEFQRATREGATALVAVFEKCTVKLGARVLFDPSWGTYDLACGAAVTSVFGGAPDRARYLAATGGFSQKPARQTSNETPANKALAALYEKVRIVRESGRLGPHNQKELAAVHAELERSYPGDWLLRLELLELDGPWSAPVRARLGELARSSPRLGELIDRGVGLL